MSNPKFDSIMCDFEDTSPESCRVSHYTAMFIKPHASKYQEELIGHMVTHVASYFQVAPLNRWSTERQQNIIAACILHIHELFDKDHNLARIGICFGDNVANLVKSITAGNPSNLDEVVIYLLLMRAKMDLNHDYYSYNRLLMGKIILIYGSQLPAELIKAQSA